MGTALTRLLQRILPALKDLLTLQNPTVIAEQELVNLRQENGVLTTELRAAQKIVKGLGVGAAALILLFLSKIQ